MGTDYETLLSQVRALAQTEPHFISVMANTSALLAQFLPDLNWAGFYIVMDGQLKVGPFQGKPACVLIGKGRGVCGTSWERDETIVVPDVHAFPGHIACDSASNAEIVIPLHRRGEVAAVLDIDSPVKDRFSQQDQDGLEQLAKLLDEMIRWS